MALKKSTKELLYKMFSQIKTQECESDGSTEQTDRQRKELREALEDIKNQMELEEESDE